MSDTLLQLNSLKSISDGDINYELELIDNLTAECDLSMEAMNTSYENGDVSIFAEHVHKFKGSMVYLTKEPMIGMLSKMDRDAHQKSILPTLEEFRRLQVYFEEIKDLLEDYKATL